jgi:hypothetical protein
LSLDVVDKTYNLLYYIHTTTYIYKTTYLYKTTLENEHTLVFEGGGWMVVVAKKSHP